MRPTSTLALAFVMLLAPCTALALGLGEIEARSALNERFDARIPLVSATPEELETLEVMLASREAFERYGISRPFELQSLRFEIVTDGAAAPYVQISSREPIREPFLTFLVEADWASGRLLREYTVLLDPPVFDEQAQPPAAQAPAAAPADTRTETRTTGTVLQTAPQPEARPPAEPGAYPDTPPYTAPEGTYGRIKRGETLSGIARKLKPADVSLNQMMIALFRANPDAFMDNINLLKQGSVLRVPDLADVRAISRAEANRVVREHVAAWRGGGRVAAAGGGEGGGEASLSLVAPGEGGSGSAAEGAGTGVDAGAAAERVAALQQQLTSTREALAEAEGENETLQARVAALESEIAEVRRLLEIKDNQLLALQQQAEQAGGQTGTAGEPVPDSEQPAETVAEVVEEAVPETEEPAVQPEAGVEPQQPVAEQPEATQAEAEPGQTAAETPAAQPETQPVQRQPVRRDQGLLDTVLDYLGNPLLLGGLLGLLLLALAGVMLARRRAAQAEATRSGADWVTAEENETAFEETSEPTLGEDDETTATGAPEPEAGEGEMLETTLISSSPLDQEEAGGGEAAAEEEGQEDTLVGGGAVDLDESDPLSEADFHMAYGLYDQAAEGLRKAMDKNPERRREFQNKLLEVYFTAGNQDEFVATARQLHEELGGAGGGDWQNVVIMGRQIAPDEPLFQEGTSTGTDSVVDLDIGGAEEPSAESGGEELPDFELPAGEEAAPAAEETEKAESGGEDVLEFDLGDLGGGEESEAEGQAGEESLDLSFDEAGGTDSQTDFDKALEELSSSGVGTASMVGDEEPSQTAEVDTKLDLARAYIDMGDPDGARSILEEVMEDGNDNQKQQAQELLDQLA